MGKVELEKLLKLRRRSPTEKPKSELIVLALTFFNGGKISINELKEKVRTNYNKGWFCVESIELDKIIPNLISRNLLDVEGTNYVIPGHLISVLKDLVEENLFPGKEQVETNFEALSVPLKDTMGRIVSNLTESKFFQPESNNLDELQELETYGLLIFTRSFFYLR